MHAKTQQPATVPMRTEAALDSWRFVRCDRDPAGFARDGSLFALSNGLLGVRGGLEEDLDPAQVSLLTPVWERSPIEYHERFPGFARSTDTRLPVVDGTRIALHLDGTPLDLRGGEWERFERALDLREGRYERSLRWRDAGGTILDIRAERVLPLTRPGVMALRYRVRADARAILRLDAALVADRGATAQGDDPRIGARIDGGLDTILAGADADTARVHQATQRSGARLVCLQRTVVRKGPARFAEATTDAVGAHQLYVAELNAGGEIVLEKYVAYAADAPGEAREWEDLEREAAGRLAEAVAAGFDALAAEQRAALEPFWTALDLDIDGDPESEQILRLNLFHLRQAASGDGRASIPAKGLTGEGYEGHYFWDAEAFMLPALAFTAPPLARAMLAWRHRILDRARAHARQMNHARGALFAWRTISGDECSAYFPSGSAQYHINAAIAWAIRLYVEASGDEDFLAGPGAEILFETARVWLDAGHFDARRGGAFCIHAVTGPDEYTALVDNNHYTNRMARAHLRQAAATACWLRAERGDDWQALAARIDLQPTEIDDWKRAAEAMYLAEDAALGVFPQDDTFLDKPRLPPQDETAGKQPLLLRMHPLSIYRHQVCKQADVLLALMLDGDDVDLAAKQRNFDYYEGVTVHDSTLSASTFGVLAAEVGRPQRAWDYFTETLRVDLDDRHGNAAHGVHMAAMAGGWLGLAWGFGGLRVREGRPAFAPTLPQHWNGYRFGVDWRGRHIRVEVDRDGVRYTLDAGPPLEIEHDGARVLLEPGRSPTCPPATPERALDARRPALPGPFEAIVFDLDGVIADTAGVHLAAWRRLAEELRIPFDDAVAERLKGVDRAASLDIVLEASERRFDVSEKRELAARKNAYYRAQIEQFGPQHLLPGARAAIESARAAGLRLALASASRNAPLLLERLGIADLFDHIVDAGRIRRSKPDPEIFLAAAAGLGLRPERCLAVEDAEAGIASARAAGMATLGVGSEAVLAAADRVIGDMQSFDLGHYLHAGAAARAGSPRAGKRTNTDE